MLSELSTNAAVLLAILLEATTDVQHFTAGFGHKERIGTLKSYSLIVGMNFAALVVSNTIRDSRLERLRTLDDRLSRQDSQSLLEDTDDAKEAERQMYKNHTALLLSFGVFSMFSAVWSVTNVKTPVPGRD